MTGRDRLWWLPDLRLFSRHHRDGYESVISYEGAAALAYVVIETDAQTRLAPWRELVGMHELLSLGIACRSGDSVELMDFSMSQRRLLAHAVPKDACVALHRGVWHKLLDEAGVDDFGCAVTLVRDADDDGSLPMPRWNRLALLAESIATRHHCESPTQIHRSLLSLEQRGFIRIDQWQIVIPRLERFFPWRKWRKTGAVG
jgi:hypothetical protein